MCWRRLSSTGATQALNLSTRRGNVMKISDPREHIWINTCVQKPREYLCAKYLDVCNNIWIKHLCAKASPSTAKGQAVARSPLTANLRNVPMFFHVCECRFKFSHPMSPAMQCCYQQCCHCHRCTINGKRVVVCECMNMRQHRGGDVRRIGVFVVWLSLTNTESEASRLV